MSDIDTNYPTPLVEYATIDEAHSADLVPAGAELIAAPDQLKAGATVLIQARLVHCSWEHALILKIDGDDVTLLMRGMRHPKGGPLIVNVKTNNILASASEH